MLAYGLSTNKDFKQLRTKANVMFSLTTMRRMRKRKRKLG
jgi:hypothetical protein